MTLVVEDADGRRVRNLLSETQFLAGENVAWWDGLDDLGRDPDAARHGLYQLPARFVSPGEYRVRGLVHPPIHLRYEFSIYNAGSPAWETEDNRGGWLANHTPPSAVLFIRERDANRSPAAPSPGGCILAGSYVSEGGHGLAWLDVHGRKRYGQMWVGGVWTGDVAPGARYRLEPRDGCLRLRRRGVGGWRIRRSESGIAPGRTADR